MDDFGWTRSADYNPIYYNPMVTYRPWHDAYINGKTVSFSDADPRAVKSHPVFGGSSLDITQEVLSYQDNWTFTFLAGMTVPAGAEYYSNRRWRQLGSAYTLSAGETLDVAMAYYIPTYYVRTPGCTSGCVPAYDGVPLRKYEIRPNVANYPSGRTYAQELQNFANWFQYYRKRRLMLAAAMGEVLPQVPGIRAGLVYFNQRAPVSMSEFSSTDSANNAQSLLGKIYANPASGGTPTRQTLSYIGDQFKSNASIVQYACQANAAFILSDGFAEATDVFPPSYPNTWVQGAPFQTIFKGTLADIAASYYTNNLRPDLPTGRLSVDDSSTNPLVDKNPNLHMNTFAMTLGARGLIYGVDEAATKDPVGNPPTWADPQINRNPTAVDDLWHATLVGRGGMYVSDTVEEVVSKLTAMFRDLLITSGTQGGVGVSEPVIQSDTHIYVSSFNAQSWSGDVHAYSAQSGATDFSKKSALWSASAMLDALDPAKRKIVIGQGGSAVPFRYGDLSSTLRSQLNSPYRTDASAVVDWLRGVRTSEGSTYRQRNSVLGDIVHGEPVPVGAPSAPYGDTGYVTFKDGHANRTAIVLASANDGMLHAFSAADGSELWSVIPSAVTAELNALSRPLYSHRFYVDATPVVGDMLVSGQWRTLLVGGLRAGGKGYFALDLTQTTAADEQDVAQKYLWDFPGPQTASADARNVGHAYGHSLLVKTETEGWVVVVASGYNNSDYKGHLFVLDPATGRIIKDIVTPDGNFAAPAGLAHLSAFASQGSTSAMTDYVYGGDLQGNIWRFDLTGPAKSWGVQKLAQLTDAYGNAQPVTSPVELALVEGLRMVFVTTGKLLEEADVRSRATQSVYGLVDDLSNNPEIKKPRTTLTAKAVTVSGQTRHVSDASVDLTRSRGWYFDLPGSGERVIHAPSAAFGLLVFVSNLPSDTACSSQSWLYAIDMAHGGQAPSNLFDGNPWSGMSLGNQGANRPQIVQVPGHAAGVKAIVSKTDRSVSEVPLPTTSSAPCRAIAWQEIFR